MYLGPNTRLYSDLSWLYIQGFFQPIFNNYTFLFSEVPRSYLVRGSSGTHGTKCSARDQTRDSKSNTLGPKLFFKPLIVKQLHQKLSVSDLIV